MTPHRVDALEELRVVVAIDGSGRRAIECRRRASPRATWGPWSPRAPRSLLDHAVDSPVWDWLRASGIRRPSPPSKSGPSRQRADRDGATVEARLTPEAATALTKLVPEHYESRTAAVNAALVALVASVK